MTHFRVSNVGADVDAKCLEVCGTNSLDAGSFAWEATIDIDACGELGVTKYFLGWMAIDYARFDSGWALLNTDTTVEKSKGFVNVELFNGLGEFFCGV
mgnify:FL=1